MSVVVSIEELGQGRKQLRIAVPTPAVEAETDRVAREFRQRVRLPGFRQGKVPLEIVRRRFQKDIEREVVDRLVPRYWRQAQAESNLEPLLPPRLEEIDLQPDALSFVATVEIRPEIEIGDLGGFRLPDPPVEATAEEVEKALEDLRRDVADRVPVERPAVGGDLVTAHLTEVSAAGEPAGEAQVVTVEIGDPRVWEELTLAVTGLAPGQEARFTRREGEGEAAPERHFRVKATAVKERQLPPLDETLPARLGDFADLEAVREEIRRGIRRAKADDRRRQRERAVLEQLRERHPVTLPSGVVDHEIEHLLQEYAEGLARQGVDVERSALDWQSLAAEVRPQAERRVHSRLLLDAVVAREGLGVSESEFEAALATLARGQGRPAAAVRQALHEQGRLGELRRQLEREKALRRLLGEETAEPAGETEPQPTGKG